ncbi:ABC transporter permease [Homoserinimonas sp. OAct 916]|uniref:ABC transporter permease n=1 Tax=Homoserinimonas sp. OAct 916 TaxID=2211450 RepID=UPI000DBE5426|nr:ABC transporter permease [Homoserinimonas sp. OAct 916]
MLTFVIRRLGASVLVLLGASFIIYVLAANAGDPLEDLRASTAINKEQLIQARITLLNLDVPAPLRYFIWLGGVLRFFIGDFDLGKNLAGQEVTALVGSSMWQTIQLVTFATIIAIVIGVAIGMTTALRQYSGYDYSVTFLAFLFFSLPVFFVAVLLKQYVAIGFNNFLADPVIPPVTIVVLSLISGFVWMSIIGGDPKPRLIVFGSATLITAAVLGYLLVTNWFQYPGLGPVLILGLGALGAVAGTAISTGISNRRALYASLVPPVLGALLWYPLQFVMTVQASAWLVPILIGAFLVGGGAIGYAMGLHDKWVAARGGAASGAFVAILLVLDRIMQSWPDYVTNTGGRPIATIGGSTPDLHGSIWIGMLDSYTHLLLPTVALLLISLASYSRYARASLLEVMNQDYVRTARAKGLTERTVIMRHAFRNAMIPIATIIAFDVGGLIGGAIITERIFAWKGMGSLFQDALDHVDMNPLMAFILIVSALTVIANLLADVAYSILDPRIRVG